MKYVIGADIGTSGTKTVIFDKEGHAIASASEEYPLYQPENGMAEQNPEDWKNAVMHTIAAAVKKSGIEPADIAGIGLSGQMHGLVMLDKNNRVLRNAIIWCDQRTAAECEDIEALVGHDRLIEITANPALAGFTASKIMWVKKHEPEIYASCAHILLPKDYIRFCLTGVYATEVSDASGMQLLDVPARNWSDEILEKLGIDKALLGRVYESPEITGYVTKEAAALTGLCEGTPVVGGAGDNAAAAVGTGVVCDGTAFTTIGTSGVVFLHTDEAVIDKKERVHTFCCAVPGCWHVMGVTQAAGLSLRWFRDNFCYEEKMKEAENGGDAYDYMTALAAASPIGANGLLFAPYLMGERTPHLDSAVRGAFTGISAIHNRGDMIRAVMEGVTYSLTDCLSVFGEMKLPVSSMYACGGGGRSPFWRQMLADCFGCEVSFTGSNEGAALGAAILAMTGTGMYSDVREACRAIISPQSSVMPDSQAREKYSAVYEKYKKVYPALKMI